MASGSEILKELFISLGWKYDESTSKKVTQAEHKTTQELEKESKARDAMAKKARENLDLTIKTFAKFAAGAQLMAVGVVAAIESMANSFEKAYYSSSRTGASVKEMNAFSYAASQMGSSAEEAQSAVEGLAKAQREMPGYATMMRGLGAKNPKNIVQSLNDIAPKLASMPMAQAEAYAHTLHMPENLLLAMRHVDEFRKYEGESDKKYDALGFDPDKSARDGKDLSQSFRSLYETIKRIGQDTGSGSFANFNKTLKDLNSFLEAHGKQISDILWKISDALLSMLKYVVEHLPVLDSFVDTIGGWNKALGALGTVVTAAYVARFVSLFGAMRGLAGLTLPPWALSILGVGAAGAATVGEVNRPYGDPNAYRGSGMVGLRKHQHDREEDAAGPWGTVKRWWGRNAPTWAGGNPASAGGGGTGKTAPVSNEGNFHNLTDLTEQVAKEAGIDPRIMHGIRAGESGHRSNYDIGDLNNGPAYGPWQLNVGPGRLGDRFQRETGLDLRDPKTIPAQTRWVAKYIASRLKRDGNYNPGREWFGYHGNRDASPRWGDSGYVPDAVKKAQHRHLIHLMTSWPGGRGVHPTFGGALHGMHAFPLGGAANSNNRHVTIHQNNHNHVTGVSDPTAAAAQIGARQDRHSSMLLRNMKSAVV